MENDGSLVSVTEIRKDELILIIAQFILAFGVMVFLHELGHFLAGKLFKVEIEEFGIGLPPRMIKLFTWGGTLFSLNWLPFGAFVKPKGEFENDASSGGFKSAKPWQQLLIFVSGPLMNLLTAFVIYIVCFLQIGYPDQTTVLIDRVEPSSPAESAGLRIGDQITKIGGQKVDAFSVVTDYVDRNLDKEITIEVNRNGVLMELSLTPDSSHAEDRGPMGIVITYPMEDYTIGEGIIIAASETITMIRQYITGIGQLITGKVQMGIESIVGPVGMFSFYQDAAKMDEQIEVEQEQRKAERMEEGAPLQRRTASDAASPWLNRLSFFAIISIALGVTNLFPIPALDGGRILFLIPELIFRKKLPDKFEYYFNSIGMICLLILMAVIMFKDIFMLSNG